MGRKQDSFRQNLMCFISIILRSLVIFAEQFFSALVGGSGNGGLTFAPLPDGNAEMWTGNKPSLPFLGVAGFTGAGACPCCRMFHRTSCSKQRRSRRVSLAERNSPGKRCIIAPCARGGLTPKTPLSWGTPRSWRQFLPSIILFLCLVLPGD